MPGLYKLDSKKGNLPRGRLRATWISVVYGFSTVLQPDKRIDEHASNKILLPEGCGTQGELL